MDKHTLTEITKQVREEGSLPLLVVTTGTRDHKEKFVARLHVISGKGGVSSAPTHHHVISDTLAELRLCMPSGCEILPRSTMDDATIVESWV